MNDRSWDGLAATAIFAIVAASRLPWLVDFAYLGKDGPLYIQALAFDHNYSVPMPGNVGFVALARLAQLVLGEPWVAYAACTVGLSALGASLTFLIGRPALGRPLAAAAGLAMAASPTLWWHGTAITSYPVWIAALPAIGLFGLRFARGRRTADAIAASVALGVSTILRQDMIAFGLPLWAGCLALGRAPRRTWLAGSAIVGLSCLAWFAATSAILGGPDAYLARVEHQHAFHHGFSLAGAGLVEGLGRNGSKFALFLIWSSAMALPFAALGVAGRLAAWRSGGWRAPLVGLLWPGPATAFALIIFAGNAGLIFPLLPLLYLAAADGLLRVAGPRLATATLASIALLGAAQFALVPLAPERDQRAVIWNVTFAKYGGHGIKHLYNYNLDDYGIDPGLKSVLAQLRDPQPVPSRPAPNRPGLARNDSEATR